MSHHHFLIGLGSNIAPVENMALMVRALLPHIEHITLSRVLTTPPVGMNTHRHFLNAVAYIKTPLSAKQLKVISNQIEAEMGRDRSDPDSKMKDRPADIDILCCGNLTDFAAKPASAITDEYFLYPLIDELFAHLTDESTANMPEGVTIDYAGLFFGQTPTTIHRNTDPGEKGVLQQAADR